MNSLSRDYTLMMILLS